METKQSAEVIIHKWVLAQYCSPDHPMAPANPPTHDQAFDALAGYIVDGTKDEDDRIGLIGRVARAPIRVEIQEKWFRRIYGIIDKYWWPKLYESSQQWMKRHVFQYQCLLFQELIQRGLFPDWMDRFPRIWKEMAGAIQSRDNVHAHAAMERMWESANLIEQGIDDRSY